MKLSKKTRQNLAGGVSKRYVVVYGKGLFSVDQRLGTVIAVVGDCKLILHKTNALHFRSAVSNTKQKPGRLNDQKLYSCSMLSSIFNNRCDRFIGRQLSNVGGGTDANTETKAITDRYRDTMSVATGPGKAMLDAEPRAESDSG